MGQFHADQITTRMGLNGMYPHEKMCDSHVVVYNVLIRENTHSRVFVREQERGRRIYRSLYYLHIDRSPLIPPFASHDTPEPPPTLPSPSRCLPSSRCSLCWGVPWPKHQSVHRSIFRPCLIPEQSSMCQTLLAITLPTQLQWPMPRSSPTTQPQGICTRPQLIPRTFHQALLCLRSSTSLY